MGTIAGKVWGSGPHPILAVHGWLDNCGSFDPIIPRLPLDKFHVIAVDLPGHGFSQKHPPGMSYTITDGLVLIKKTQEHFGLKRSVCMGHSMGGGMCGMFAATFPEPLPMRKHVRATRRSVKMHMKYTDLLHNTPEGKIPRYSYEDAVQRAFLANQLIHGSDSISKESVKILMKRGLRQLGDGLYTWNTDLRLRVPSFFNLLEEQAEHYVSNIECPHLIVKASDSPFYMPEDAAMRLIKVMINNNPNFVYETLDGGHHCHMDSPDDVASVVNSFLGRTFDKNGSEEKRNVNFKL